MIVNFFSNAAASLGAQPSTLQEIFSGQINRRIRVDLTNYKFARITVGGGAAGATNAELRCEYSLNGTDWTYLNAAASGPRINILGLGGGNAAQASSPFVQIDALARDVCWIRVISILGDASTTPSCQNVDVEFIGTPFHVGNSLTGATAGRSYVCVGGSQAAGGGDAGEFGAIDPALKDIPVAVTMVRQGSVITQFQEGGDDFHGIEAGIIAEFIDAGLTTNLKIIARYVDATTAADWVSTHLQTAKNDCTANSINPVALCYIGSGSDGNSDTTVANYDENLRDFLGKCEQLWPGIAVIFMPAVSGDIVDHPKLNESIDVSQRRFAAPFRGRTVLLDHTGISVQSDFHPDSEGTVVAGQRFGAALIAGGIT